MIQSVAAMGTAVACFCTGSCRTERGCSAFPLGSYQFWPSTPVTAPAAPLTVPMGWQCPKCSRVYAPSVTACSECNAHIVSGR